MKQKKIEKLFYVLLLNCFSLLSLDAATFAPEQTMRVHFGPGPSSETAEQDHSRPQTKKAIFKRKPHHFTHCHKNDSSHKQKKH